MICERRHHLSSSYLHFSSPAPSQASCDSDIGFVDDLFLDDSDWMQEPPLDGFNTEHWMQQSSADAYAQSYSPHPDYYSFPQRSANDNRTWSQTYSDGFSPYSVSQTRHRRALSNSTASTNSPQQHHAGYPQHLLDTNQYRHLQYYPTPIQTPTSGSFMEQQQYAGRGGHSSAPRQSAAGQVKPQPPQIQTNGPQYPPQVAPGYSSGYLTPHSAHSNSSTPHPMPQYGENYAQHPPHPPHGNSFGYAASQQQPQHAHLQPSMTQTCANEGYNPLMNGRGPAQPQQQPSHFNMPDHMSERLEAANAQRQGAPPNQQINREPSPYRPESQLAREDSNYNPKSQGTPATAAHMRQQQKYDHDTYQYWRHHTRGVDPGTKSETISPKDAYLDDFKEAAEQSSDGTPLFPASTSSSQQQLFRDSRQNYNSLNGSRQAYPPTSTFDFVAPVLPASASTTDFKFAPLSRQASSLDDTPSHLVSMETSNSEPDSSQDTPAALPNQNSSAGTSGSSNATPMPIRPSGSISTADTGTYSCTYIGCPQRFPTPALLQKHKKEAHRPAPGSATRGTSAAAVGLSSPTGDGTPRSDSPTKTADALSQAGPHRCDRINPSTGKPCATVFSRPYDLTRHEDTIHARRPKVHCQYCAQRGEEKTFSRADALTRHLRVVHPDVEVRGLHGRRRGL